MPRRATSPGFSTGSYASIRSTPEGMLVLRILKAERAGELLSDHVWDPELIGRVVLVSLGS